MWHNMHLPTGLSPLLPIILFLLIIPLLNLSGTPSQSEQGKWDLLAKRLLQKDRSFQRCMKSKPMIFYDETVFHINFAPVPHFPCSGIDFKMRTPVAASLCSWPTKISFSLGFIVHLHCDWTGARRPCLVHLQEVDKNDSIWHIYRAYAVYIHGSIYSFLKTWIWYLFSCSQQNCLCVLRGMGQHATQTRRTWLLNISM